MNILIVECECERSGPMPQVHALRADGHEVLFAESGDEVMAILARGWPNLILMNTPMQESCAHEMARRIKAYVDEHRYVPVVFLSPIHDDSTLARFVEGYADDFVELPHNPLSLKAKLAIMERAIQTQQSLMQFKQKTEHEISMAKQMFDALTRRMVAEVPNMRHWTWTAGHFSGDVLFYEKTPDGRLHVMLGDFTGHGLASAVGALPTSDAFFAMTRKGLPLPEIAAEINAKLHTVLPTGYFCATCLLAMDAECSEVEVWNGGLPPVLMLDGKNRVVAAAESNRLPLGIQPPELFERETARFVVPPDFSLVMYSDGLTEAVNPAGEMFGDTRLQLAMFGSTGTSSLMDAIKGALISFMDGLEPVDDVSLVMLGSAS